MRRYNLVMILAALAVVISLVFGQSESFVPRDLAAQAQTANPTSFKVSLPFSKSLSLSLFQDYAPPPKRSFQQPKMLVGRTVLGSSVGLSLGEFQFRSTLLRSGMTVSREFPDDGNSADVTAVFVPPSPAMGFRSPSAFRDGMGQPPLLFWKGEFSHQSVAYQSSDGRFRAAVHYAEADPQFQPATLEFSQKLANETGLQLPLNAAAGIKAKQGEAEWKPDGKTTVRAFANTVTGQNGGVVETRAIRLGNAHLKMQWDKVRAEDMNKMSLAAGAAQQQVVNRMLSEGAQNTPNRQAPMQIGNWQLWRNLKQEGLQASYENKGVKLGFERRDITGTGGSVEQSNINIVLGKERLVWQRQHEDVAKGSNPEALKALGLTALIPRIGWKSNREKLVLKFSSKDGFNREEFRMSNASIDITRSATNLSLLKGRLTFRERFEDTQRVDPNFLKAIGMEKDIPRIGWAYQDRELRWQLSSKDSLALTRYRYEGGRSVLEREGTRLTLLSGRLQWEEQREQLSSSVDPDFLKVIGWEQVQARLGWSSLQQRLSWQLTQKERLAYSRSRYESSGTAVERKTFTASLMDGRLSWERTQDEASPTLNAEQLKKLGMSDLASRIGWNETQDRFSWQFSPNLAITHTRDSAEALPDSPQPFREKQGHETVVTLKPDAKKLVPPMTIAFGGWTLVPKGENALPVTERHLRWDTMQRLPLLGGLQLTVQRHFTETKQGEKEHDTRFARTVLQTGDKAPLQLYVERVTNEETGKEQREALNAHMSLRLAKGLQLTTQLNKTPQGNTSVETRQHTLAYQTSPDFAITTQFTRTEQGSTEREQTDLTVKLGDPKKSNQQWQLSRFATNTPAKVDVKGWRLSWTLAVLNRLKLTTQLGRLEREDERDSGEEKLTMELPSKNKDGLTWRFGYWRLSLLDTSQQQQTAQQLMQAAQVASQPVPQAGTPPATVVNPQADSYRTVWAVASKSDLHIGAQISQAEGKTKEATDQRVYLELPAGKSRPLALRLGYWKLRQWNGNELEIPIWRLVLSLGKGKLAWGAATYRDQKGELPIREFALILPLDKKGSQLTVSNFTNMPPNWSQQWQHQDWMKFTGGTALAPQLLFTRQQLAPFKLHQANLTLHLSPDIKLVGGWEEQIGVPNFPITHDWRLALELTPEKTVQWRFEYAKLKNDEKQTVRTDLFGISYNQRLSDSRFVTLSVRWMENPLLKRPNFQSDRWLASLSLSQRW